jgi:hypothetical protein
MIGRRRGSDRLIETEEEGDLSLLSIIPFFTFTSHSIYLVPSPPFVYLIARSYDLSISRAESNEQPPEKYLFLEKYPLCHRVDTSGQVCLSVSQSTSTLLGNTHTLPFFFFSLSHVLTFLGRLQYMLGLLHAELGEVTVKKKKFQGKEKTMKERGQGPDHLNIFPCQDVQVGR